MSDDNTTPLPDDGGSAPSHARGSWVRRHGPGTLIGALIVSVAGAAATIILTALFGGGDGGAGASAAGASGGSGTSADADVPPDCAGAACTGLDPEVTRCGGAGARTLTDNWARTMHLEIRYSPRCDAVWAKLTGAQVGDTVSIATSPSGRQTATVQTGHDKYTPMLPVEVGFSARATAVAVKGNPDQDIPKGYTIRLGAERTHLPTGGPSTTGS
ncbi:DUF2690 domain-containing protein [Streptomyces scopuliridis]|uniref:DUF2690 domain-containing protein n=1 Tax=Streptomyces scopuliridis TaxID=452529 RepID=UPI0035E08227